MTAATVVILPDEKVMALYCVYTWREAVFSYTTNLSAWLLYVGEESVMAGCWRTEIRDWRE